MAKDDKKDKLTKEERQAKKAIEKEEKQAKKAKEKEEKQAQKAKEKAQRQAQKAREKAKNKAQKSKAAHQAKNDASAVPRTHDENGVPYRPPFAARQFQSVLSQCKLQWPTQPKYNKVAVGQGQFEGYAHADFCLTNDNGNDACMSMAMTGAGCRCELRHGTHWSITDASAAAATGNNNTNIYLKATICIPPVDASRVESFTFAQIHTHDFKDRNGQTYEKGPFLRMAWKHKVRGGKNNTTDAIVAILREDLRRQGKANTCYDLNFPRPDGFFDLLIAVVYNPDSQHYELKIDLDGVNRLTKDNIDFWAPMYTNYFKAGCYLGSGVDDQEPTAKVLFKALEIGVPGESSSSPETCHNTAEVNDGSGSDGSSSSGSDDSDSDSDSDRD